MTTDTIIALCTPRGSGAIALLRLSGSQAVAIADQMAQLSSKQKLSERPSHTIHHGTIIAHDGSTIDEVLFLLMRAPKTFTGEDTVEITTHNNQFIIEQIISRALQCGAQLARPGEFTQMAFLNGKLDLARAEALHEVIGAQSEHALKIAMAQMHGSLSSYCKQIEQALTELLCFVEASFEFLDEEQRDLDFDGMVRARIKKLHEDIAHIVESFPLQEQVRQGVRIALVGSVNAGKSTLFNALVGSDRAIVTAQAGTTRDSIEATIFKNGHFWTLIDTAGLRQTEDVIEQEGIRRSYQEAAKADAVLLVIDSSAPLTVAQQEAYSALFESHRSKIISVLSKTECATQDVTALAPITDAAIAISVHNRTGVDELVAAIQARVDQLFAGRNAPFLLNARQRALMENLAQKVAVIAELSAVSIEYELVAYHVHEALALVSELTGKNVNEQVLDTIFRSFCVGK